MVFEKTIAEFMCLVKVDRYLLQRIRSIVLTTKEIPIDSRCGVSDQHRTDTLRVEFRRTDSSDDRIRIPFVTHSQQAADEQDLSDSFPPFGFQYLGRSKEVPRSRLVTSESKDIPPPGRNETGHWDPAEGYIAFSHRRSAGMSFDPIEDQAFVGSQSPTDLDSLCAYIDNQEEQQRKVRQAAGATD